jgi:hypothetical protein
MDASDSMAKAIVDLPRTTAINARWLEEIQNPEIQPHHQHARTGALASYTLAAGIGALGGIGPHLLKAASAETGPVLPMLTDKALAKAMVAGTVVAGLDMLGQKLTDHNVGGHDLFRPTGLEALGIGMAAASQIGWRAKLAIAGFSWLAGRVENYFDA